MHAFCTHTQIEQRRINRPPHLTTLMYVFTMIAVAISVPAGLLLKYPPGTEQRNMHPTLQQQFPWSNGLQRLQSTHECVYTRTATLQISSSRPLIAQNSLKRV